MKPAKNFAPYCVKPFCSNAVAAILPDLLNFNASIGVETPPSDVSKKSEWIWGPYCSCFAMIFSTLIRQHSHKHLLRYH